MAGTLVAVFDDHIEADRAAQALVDAGVPYADISLVRKDAGGEHGAAGDTRPGDTDEAFVSHRFREVSVHDVEEPIEREREVAPRAAAGFMTGAPLGALLVVTAVAIPGIGPLIAAGPLAAMLTASLGGGVIGALVGALTAGGIPEDRARHYHERVEQGDTLVTVLAGEQNHGKIETLLQEKGGRDTAYFARFLDTIQTVESDNAKL